MNKGKKVDDGNNLVGGIGGLNSYSNMAGTNYKEYYQDLLEGNEMKGLPQEYKKYLGSGNDNLNFNNQKEIKINNINDDNNNNNGNDTKKICLIYLINLINLPKLGKNIHILIKEKSKFL